MPPVGVAAFPNENTDPLRECAERSYNGHHWTDMSPVGISQHWKNQINWFAT